MQKPAIRILCAVALLSMSSTLATAQPKKPDATKAQQHASRAKIAFGSQQWDTAIAELRTAYDYDPQPKYLYNLGLASEAAGKKRLALEAFRGYLAKDANGAYAVTAAAKVKKLESALIREKREADAARLANHLTKAASYRKAGRHDAAAFEYRRAYELTKNAEHLFEVAESYRRIPAKDRALAAYREYLAADSSGKFAISARSHIRELERGKQLVETRPSVDASASARKTKWLWVAAGAAVFAAGIVVDVVPSSGSNGKFDATDVLPIGMYGLGVGGIVLGVF